MHWNAISSNHTIIDLKESDVFHNIIIIIILINLPSFKINEVEKAKSSYRSFRNSLFRFRNVDTSICSDSPCCSYNWDNCCVKSDTKYHQSKVFVCMNCHPKHMRCVFVIFQQYRYGKTAGIFFWVKLYCYFWHVVIMRMEADGRNCCIKVINDENKQKM